MRFGGPVRHRPGRGATSSINYISAHDGFTLADLTSYDHKHNEANGENNNDGTNVNHSANFGVEGPTDDLSIESARERSRMNMLGTLILSLGTPMLLAGDEFGNTQYGNNNAYCQDNEIAWLDWDWINCTEETAESRQLEATANLIAVRKSLDIYNHEDFFTRLSQLGCSSRARVCSGACRMARCPWIPIGATRRCARS